MNVGTRAVAALVPFLLSNPIDVAAWNKLSECFDVSVMPTNGSKSLYWRRADWF
ncbi:hypothetical protein A5888_001285 [Enterococcus sp. 9E7_DIV0242]|uniref:Uncharacterized protein n=1 Tax=Candidatus Enterococcus clewellii TaxID=1834193 RepID=A0AAQ3Y0F6_9ENTE